MDSKSIQEDISELRQSSLVLKDVFDRVKVSQRIDKHRVALAKMYVDRACALLLGNLETKKSIGPDETAKIVALVHEIAKGRREKLYLEISPDHSEIIDCVSKKRFKLH